MALEVTPEMRQAVLAEICKDVGHSHDLRSLLGSETDDNGVPQSPLKPLGPEGQLPFIRCERCGKALGVFIALEGDDYDEVEEKVAAMMRDRTELEKRRRPRKNQASRN